jgi:FkbM family methyltransferase
VTWVSYAQNYEDVVLARVLADVPTGFYVDAGAQDPRMDSVTRAFYERGWHGINLEPVPHWHARLVADRPRDANLAVAAGAAPGEIRFFEVGDSGLSTGNAAFAARHRAAGHRVDERRVPVQRLDAICTEQGVGAIHFLKVDVEGAEAEVLAGMDFARWRPWVVLVEATEPNSRTRNHADWEPLLLGHGYAFAYDDGVNRFYLADEHAALAPRFGPPTVLDDFVRREQVDLAAALESRLADVDALSHRRAAEIEALVARIADKDASIAAGELRWADAVRREQELVAEVGWRSEEIERRQAEIERLGAEQAALAERLAAAAAQVVAIDATLRDAQARAAADREQAAAQLAERDGQVARLHVHIAALDATLADREARIAALDARAALAERRAAQLAQALPDLEARLRTAGEAHAHAHAEVLRHVAIIDGLRAEQAVLLGSRSWRLTAPLRATNAAIAAGRAGVGELTRRLARREWIRRAAALATRPFPRLAARIKQGLYGAPVAAADVAAAGPQAPLPLTEDAARILAMAPVRAAQARDAD